MSFTSNSSGESYYWDNDVDWTDEEGEGSRGDEDGGEGGQEGAAGQEEHPPAEPDQHPGQPLHHQMILHDLAGQVTRGWDDSNLSTGPLSECLSVSECANPLSEHYGDLRLYMMSGKQLGRTPPGDSAASSELGNQAAHVGQVQTQSGPHTADGKAVQA